MRQKQITAILTLKDRSIYTKRWFQSNYTNQIEFIIADSSVSNKNFTFFSKNVRENITYIRFKPEKNVQEIAKKIYFAIKKVKTRFLFLCDNDDFINLKKIKYLSSLLKKLNKEVYGYHLKSACEKACRKKNVFKYSYSFQSGDYKKFQNLNAKKKLFLNLNSYNHFWYNLFEKKAAIFLWKIIINLKIQNIYALELAQSLLSISLFKFAHVPICHYVRISNSRKSVARSLRKSSSVFDDAFFCVKFQNDIKKLKKYLEEKKICTIDEFNIGFKQFLINQLSLITIILNKIKSIKIKILSQLCFKKSVF